MVQLAKNKVETEDGGSQEVTTLVLDNVAAKDADVFNIAKADEKGRMLTGLANGSIAENSKDAVTGGQLNQTQDAIGKLLGGGAKIDSNGNVYYDENGAALTVNGQGYKTVAEAIEAIDQGSLFRVQ